MTDFSFLSEQQGASRVVWWLLGIVSAALLAGVGAWMHNTNAQVSSNTTSIASMSKDIEYIRAHVDQIETKVDGLTVVRIKH